jgi:hypothetical protein
MSPGLLIAQKIRVAAAAAAASRSIHVLYSKMELSNALGGRGKKQTRVREAVEMVVVVVMVV